MKYLMIATTITFSIVWLCMSLTSKDNDESDANLTRSQIFCAASFIILAI